jgi:cystathionine beta-lyase family protein involved in aluminum resistance
VVQADAVKYLHTLAALQEVFKQFATPPAGNTKQQLQQVLECNAERTMLCFILAIQHHALARISTPHDTFVPSKGSKA